MSDTDNKRLLGLSLAISIIGLFLLAVGVTLKEPRHTNVVEVTADQKGEFVALTGYASTVTHRNGHLFFTLRDTTGQMKVVLFQNDLLRQNFDALDVNEGVEIQAEGRIEVYKGNLELVATRVTLL